MKTCEDCPFLNLDYDDWAPGDDTIATCNLVDHNNLNNDNSNQQDNCIKVYSMGWSNDGVLSFRPSWCPLENDKISVELF